MTDISTRNKLKLLSKWLKSEEAYIDHYSGDGALESAIKRAETDTCNRIGDFIEEILDLSDEAVIEGLNDTNNV